MRAILTLILLATSQAFAMSSGSSNDEKNFVVCERYLTDVQAEAREKTLDSEFLGRPFVIWTVHEMTAAGLRKMGLDPNSSERALNDLVLIVERTADRTGLVVKLNRWANNGFKTIQRFVFTEVSLSDYRFIKIANEHMNLQHAELEGQYPSSDSRRPSDFWVGYKTDDDQDGVRRYLTFRKTSSTAGVTSTVTFGLDVPPSFRSARRFTPDVAEVTDDLRTPAGNRRRIGVLSFARVD